MSDVYPDDEPGPDTPAWASSSTMAWERVPEQRRGPERWRTEDTDDVPRVEKRSPPRPEGRTYGTPREQRLAREPRGEPEWDFAEPAPPRERPSRDRDPSGRDDYRRGRPQPDHATGREWGRDQIPRRGRPDAPPPDYDREPRPAPPHDYAPPDYDREARPAPPHDYAPPDYDREPRPAPPARDYGYDRGPEDERAFGRGFVRGRPAGDERRSPSPPPPSPGRGPVRDRDGYDSRPRSGPTGADYSGRDGGRGVRDRDNRRDREFDDRDYDGHDARPRSGPPGPDYSGRDNGRGGLRERDYDEQDLPRPRPTSGGGVYGTARTPDAATTGELPNVGDLTVDGLPSGSPFSVSPAGPTYTSAPLTGAGVDGLQATGYMPIVRPGAHGFPPELAALAPDVPEPEPEEQAPDPEQRLAAFVFNFDPDTLREQVEGDEVTALEEIRDQLTDKLDEAGDNPTRARLLSLRAVVSRILGDLLKAFADAKLALAHAEATGELRRIAIAQARLAHVLQWRERVRGGRPAVHAGQLDASCRTGCAPRCTSTPASARTTRAVTWRPATTSSPPSTCARRTTRSSSPRPSWRSTRCSAGWPRTDWGPYPRSREEILQMRKPPSPAFDENHAALGVHRHERRLLHRPWVRGRAAVPGRRRLGPAPGRADLGTDRRRRAVAHRPGRRVPRRQQLLRRHLPGFAGTATASGSPSTRPTRC